MTSLVYTSSVLVEDLLCEYRHPPLTSCRNCLQLLKENGLQSIAFQVINSEKRSCSLPSYI
jgi:hypothetical protein